MIASADIPLTVFRQIFIWPLAAAPTGNASGEIQEEIEALAEHIGAPWGRVPDPLYYLESQGGQIPPLSPEAYQEFVYFHGFVQRFLFGKKSTLSLYERSDVRTLEVHLTPDGGPIRLEVDRLHLYLFDIGVATLVVETSSESPLTLADALTLGDYTRRAYPPFWVGSEPGVYPHRMTWLDDEGTVVAGGAMEARSELIEHVRDERCAPVAAHWRRLLPEQVELEGYAKDGGLRWRHVVDERMPTMTFVATDRVGDISCGDWVRLCFVDEAGADDLPYAKAFLGDFEARYAYDRFWGEGVYRSRILTSGYGFAMASDTSNFSLNVLQTNFRRHYFQMGLVLHFQAAALLAISDGLSKAVVDYDRERRSAQHVGEPAGRLHKLKTRLYGRSGDAHRQRFDRRIGMLRNVLLSFTHLYWFTGLSNQVQGRELYDLWRDRLGLKALYDEVGAETREVDEYLRAQREEENTDANTRLMELATIGLPLALAIGFLGINVIIGQEGGWTDCNSWATVSAVFTVFCIAGVGLVRLLRIGKISRHLWVLGISGLLITTSICLYCF